MNLYGSLENFSRFLFESEYDQSKRMIHEPKQMAAQRYCHFYERFPTGDFAETLLSGGIDASLADAFEARHGKFYFPSVDVF